MHEYRGAKAQGGGAGSLRKTSGKKGTKQTQEHRRGGKPRPKVGREILKGKGGGPAK